MILEFIEQSVDEQSLNLDIRVVCPLQKLNVFLMVFVHVVVYEDLLQFLESLLVEESQPDLCKLIVGQNQLVQMFPASDCQVLQSFVVYVVASQKKFSQLGEVGLDQPETPLITNVVVLHVQLPQMLPISPLQELDALCLNFVESDVENGQVFPRDFSYISCSLGVEVVQSDVKGMQMFPIGILKCETSFGTDIVFADIEICQVG